MDKQEMWNSWKSQMCSFDKNIPGFPARVWQDSEPFCKIHVTRSWAKSINIFWAGGTLWSVSIFVYSLLHSQINEAPERTTEGHNSHVSHNYGWPVIDLRTFFFFFFAQIMTPCVHVCFQSFVCVSSLVALWRATYAIRHIYVSVILWVGTFIFTRLQNGVVIKKIRSSYQKTEVVCSIAFLFLMKEKVELNGVTLSPSCRADCD